jgi:hypothetical protein
VHRLRGHRQAEASARTDRVTKKRQTLCLWLAPGVSENRSYVDPAELAMLRIVPDGELSRGRLSFEGCVYHTQIAEHMAEAAARQQKTETLAKLYDGKLRLERRNKAPRISDIATEWSPT